MYSLILLYMYQYVKKVVFIGVLGISLRNRRI